MNEIYEKVCEKITEQQKKRFRNTLASLFAVMFIIGASLACCGSKQDKPAEIEPAKTEIQYSGTAEYTVKAFDTLSHIAVKYIPSDEYMQQWIQDVKRLNNRKNDTIYYGEVIKVYVYEE